MSKTWGFFFGGSGHGPESSCQISAYYKLFPGKSYFYRTIANDAKPINARVANKNYNIRDNYVVLEAKISLKQLWIKTDRVNANLVLC